MNEQMRLRPLAKARLRTKLVALDLPLALHLYHQRGEPNMTMQGAFERLQGHLYQYEADLALGLTAVPEHKTVTLSIDNQVVARFELR